MTDKESKTSLPLDSEKNLLILAAKAAGWEVIKELERDTGEVYLIIDDRCGKDRYFTSFRNDGDCFRLETARGINISWQHSYVRAFYGDGLFAYEYYKDHNGDKDKARRYASTRAAALRGRE